jgi:hypothetical protein
VRYKMASLLAFGLIDFFGQLLRERAIHGASP